MSGRFSPNRKCGRYETEHHLRNRQETEAIHEGYGSRKFRGIEEQARKRLRWLDAATSLMNLAAIRGNHLEALKGSRAGQHSIRVNDRWRVCFSWRDGNAYDVEVVDYH